MRKYIFPLILNSLIFAFALLVVIPAININVFGKNIKFNGLDLSKVCVGEGDSAKCLSNFHFNNTRLSSDQTIIKLEFLDLNTDETLDTKTKDEIYKENVEILTERLHLIGINDYSVNKIVENDSKYFVEVSVPKEESANFSAMLANLTSSDPISIYQDDASYTPPETEGEEAQFNFLEGKIRSDVIGLDQIKRVSRPYFEPGMGNSGGFVIRVDFGKENTENVMVAASGTYSAQSLIPGIQLVQAGIPIGVQAVFIPPVQPGYTGQSYVVFSVLGDNLNQFRVNTLYSILSTKALNTQIQLVSTRDTQPMMVRNDVEVLKMAIPASLLLMLILAFATKKSKGVFVAILSTLALILGFAIPQLGLFRGMLNDGLIFGSIIGFTFVLLNLVWILNLDKKDFELSYLENRKLFWIMTIVFLLTLVAMASVGLPNMYLGVAYSFLGFVVAGVYCFEFVLKSLYSIFFRN